MKAMSGRSRRSLTLRSSMRCADNTGAKEVYLIGVFKIKTRKRQNPSAGIGDMVNVVVKKGKPEIRKKVFRAVVIRTKQGLRRADGTVICFEDNAVVIVDKEGIPKGSEIKGPIPKEIAERWPKIAGKASLIV